MKTPCLRDSYRRGAHVLKEQPIQMARAYSHARCESVDGCVIEGSVIDESQCPTHDG